MRAQVEAGVIYLAIAAALAALWLTGAGARGIQAIRDAAAGTPSLSLAVRPYAGGGAGGGRKP